MGAAVETHRRRRRRWRESLRLMLADWYGRTLAASLWRAEA